MYKFKLGDRLVLREEYKSRGYRFGKNHTPLKHGKAVTVSSRNHSSVWNMNIYGFKEDREDSSRPHWMNVEKNFILLNAKLVKIDGEEYV